MASVSPGRSILRASPNPFGPMTTVTFALLRPAPVHLAVYDLSGREVTVLTSGPRPAGEVTATWDGRDGTGREVAAGTYFLRLEAGEIRQASRVVLLR